MHLMLNSMTLLAPGQSDSRRAQAFRLSSVRVTALLLGLMGCERDVILPPGLSWDREPPDYLGQGRLAVTNNGDDTLAFVSLDTPAQPRLLGLANVGDNPIDLKGPHHLMASPDGRFIYFNLSNYVVNGGSGPHGAHGTGTVPGYLIKLDVQTNQSVGRVLVDRSPGDIILSADGRRAFVSHYDLARFRDQLVQGRPAAEGFSSLIIADTESMQVLSMLPLCPTMHGMGLSKDERLLYVTCSLSDQLAVVEVADPSKPVVRSLVPIGPGANHAGNPAYAPYALRVHPDGLVWISNNASQDVRAFDPVQMKMDPQKVVSLTGIAMFSDFSDDGSMLYVPHQGDDRVTSIDLATLQLRTLALPQTECLNAHELRVLPGGSAVVVCEGDHRMRKGSLVFLDLVSWAVRGSLEVGIFPDAVIRLPPLP